MLPNMITVCQKYIFTNGQVHDISSNNGYVSRHTRASLFCIRTGVDKRDIKSLN